MTHNKVRIIGIVSALLLSIAIAAGCVAREEVGRIPVNKEFIPAHDAIETVYEYKMDLLGDGDLYKYLPVVKTVHYPDEYRIQYKVIYSDDSSDLVWEEVPKDEYDNLYLNVTID